MAKSNRNWTVLFGLTILALSSSREATSADIRSLPGKDGRIVVLITGEINPGDAVNFANAVKQANDARRLVANVRLNSEGGNLLEGVKLADMIRFGKISTNIGKNHDFAGQRRYRDQAGTRRLRPRSEGASICANTWRLFSRRNHSIHWS